MSLVNDLIRRARENPPELTINDSQVGTLVAHFRGSMSNPSKAPSQLELEAKVRAGEMHFMAIPVRVLGVTPESRASGTS